ncbi:16S rRNA (guanine(527)-N(7))-methyltransferase RsmG [Ureaplasma miroungigenitalium]|uniref:Ribosomal RNA small subunit methyltransferase G n=1 Tax=Ureaplasma miroungigenitalium TaxID=1042321 RepID=A0ABT3BNB4_9BACT|nr:16S rRNA (guanine(527)-N(7))-methyltransferase RsmG [Ureaplasma miroungigenitalium]MCV3728734.1 16S rRNA (guanine(527)-N(7))-methyltransferase RsmG [Ureaplasma miroungigenitalium]MCV3734499.1 16S rRNA (guanine(527)-N(7))-methyltransferase RsmG [Ureaplasma miroungigenitalium]
MNKETFIKKVHELFPHVSATQIDLILAYKNLVQEYNQYFNLTRLDDESKIYQEFLLDSLLPYADSSIMPVDVKKKLIDIGSGSGIPGILIAIVFASYDVVLLEANAKKCTFLNTVIERLNLQNVQAWNMRAEEMTLDMRESFDIATARAVAGLYKILEISTPFVKVDGLLIEPKGLAYEAEINEALNTIKTLNLSLIKHNAYISSDKSNNVLVYRKLKRTSKQYPRKWAQIVAKPL